MRQADQGPRQDVGEDQIVGAVLAHQLMIEAAGIDETGARRIERGVLVGNAHADRIDIGADGDVRAGFGRGDGQNAGTRADIEHAVEAAALEQVVIGDQAADGGAVVTSAEGRAGFDSQIDRVQRFFAAVMDTVNKKTSGADRRQTGQCHAQPIGIGERFSADLKAVEITQNRL